MRYVVRSVALLFLSVAFLPPAFASPTQYASLIAAHARANGIPVDLAHAVVRHEIGYNARATGRAGEIGLMQIKLATARGIGYRGSKQALYNPATNIEWGMKYLGQARKLAGGDQCGTLSRYNGGLATKRMIRSYCKQVIAKVRTAPKVAKAAAPSPRLLASD